MSKKDHVDLGQDFCLDYLSQRVIQTPMLCSRLIPEGLGWQIQAVAQIAWPVRPEGFEGNL